MTRRQPYWNMHILLVYIHVKHEHIDAFIEATNENGAKTRQEPGCARFDVIQQADDPGQFVLAEAYYNPDAHASHRETEHYKAWNEKTADWVVAPRTRTIYRSISPADQDW